MAVIPAASVDSSPPAAAEAAHRDDAEGAPALEVMGHVVGMPARQADGTAITDEETVQALRLLALDNLVELVSFREAIVERDARIAQLQGQLDTWRQRAFAEMRLRERDAALSYARQRELVTVLHRQLITNEQLENELTRRRSPWWRCLFRR